MRHVLSVVMLALTAPSIVLAAESSPTDLAWPGYNNSLDGERYSSLSQINRDTVGSLGEACQVRVGEPGPFEAGPVMVDGRLFVTVGRDTLALDPRNCAILWRHSVTPIGPEPMPLNRGVAVAAGRVFRGTADGRLIALDAKDGHVLWEDVVGNSRLGETLSAAPIAWNGLLYIGVGGGDFGAKGRMLAFDQATGREIWRFDTIPTGKQPGADTWTIPKSVKTGGGGTWTSYTLDVVEGEIFIPVGNPAPDFSPTYRPGTNLFTDSVVVLDARTGALKWWYQLSPHDGHDRDLGAAPVLYRDPQIRDLVAFAAKDGFLQAVDRDTHKLVFRTALTTIVNENVEPTKTPVRICPGMLGGTEWNGPAYVPTDDLLLVGMVDWCGMLSSGSTDYVTGQIFMGGTIDMEKTGASGWVGAVDAATGKIVWRYHADAPVVAGVTPTAGGITFTGDMAGNFLVLDTKTGEVLRKIPTGGAMAGGVVTYAIDGKQYVAFAAGNVSRVTFGALGVPTIHILALGAPPLVVASSETGAAAIDPAKADTAHGKALFNQICIVCHGPGGRAVAGHSLADLKARRDFAATVAVIENPTPTMPKLYPGTLAAQDVADLAAYLQNGI